MKRRESGTATLWLGCITRAENYKDSDPFTYFCRIRGKHRMHPNTEALLEKLLVMLRDEGEEKTFAYIRNMKKAAASRRQSAAVPHLR